MTQNLLQIIVLGILAVVFATVLKKYAPDLSILLSMGATVVIGILFLRLFQPVLAFLEELRELTGLEPALLEPVLKCLGISLLSQICINVCTDAGQNAIGKMIQISACILCLYISLPLFRGVLSLMGGMGQ